jgi:hypothetical protein
MRLRSGAGARVGRWILWLDMFSLGLHPGAVNSVTADEITAIFSADKQLLLLHVSLSRTRVRGRD